MRKPVVSIRTLAVNLYRNDRQPLDTVSQLFPVSHFCLYFQVLVDNRHGLDQGQSFGCVHYSSWFSLYSDKAWRTHGDLNRRLFSPHRPCFLFTTPSQNNFSVSTPKSILTTLSGWENAAFSQSKEFHQSAVSCTFFLRATVFVLYTSVCKNLRQKLGVSSQFSPANKPLNFYLCILFLHR